MLLNSLRPAVNILKCVTSTLRSYRTDCEKIESTLSFLSLNTSHKIIKSSKESSHEFQFSARSIIQTPNKNVYPMKPNILDIPIIKMPNIVPHNKNFIINDILPIINDMDCPTTNGDVIEKKAERLIIQRRKKMKKHQLKKWRKKYKFAIKKRRQRRELKREKEFQAGLISKIKLAEAFDPDKYVTDKLKRASQVPVFEKYWRENTSNVIYHPGFPEESKAKK